MSDKGIVFYILSAILIISSSPTTTSAVPIGKAVVAIADRLAAEQIQEGPNIGSWPEETDFTGSIVAGMVDAYEMTSNSAYKTSAELGGDYIFASAQGNFFGDEAYALARLSQISTDPNDNVWRTALINFYDSIKQDFGSTQEYIDLYVGTEPSTAVFYMANHVVAAYYVEAEDKEIWREGLIDWLAQVDDNSEFPVMALGVATWALAQTGSLDEALISPSGEGAPYWNGKKLLDLPELILSHQVAEGQPGAGSFYWQFQHDESSLNGYTEDAIFPALGLVAVSWANSDMNIDIDIETATLAAREALLGGISSEGIVWERLSHEGEIYYAFAGEMLQVLKVLPIPGDINQDGKVNIGDFEILIDNWGASDCSAPSWCNSADLNMDGEVNLADLDIILDNWIEENTSG